MIGWFRRFRLWRSSSRPVQSRKPSERRFRPMVEALEDRLAPATLDFDVSGNATFTADPGFSDTATLSRDSGATSYRVQLAGGDTITLTGSIPVGWGGSGSNTVSGPEAAINSWTFNLGDGTNVLNIGAAGPFNAAIIDPITSVGAGTSDTFTVVAGGGGINTGGSVSIMNYTGISVAAGIFLVPSATSTATLGTTTGNVSLTAGVQAALSISLTSTSGNVIVGASLQTGQTLGTESINITAGGSVNFTSGVTHATRIISVQGDSDGNGGANSVQFTVANVQVRADTQTWRAGNGTGPGLTGAANLTGNTPTFVNAAGVTPITNFTYRQDAAIADVAIPTFAQFGGVTRPTNYTIDSDDGSVNITLASKVSVTNLTVEASSTIALPALAGGSSLVSLNATAPTSITLTGGNIRTTGPAGQVYNGPLLLPGNRVLTGAVPSPITFNGRVNSNNTTARNLTVSTTGATTFGGPVGGLVAGLSRPIGVLITNVGGTTNVNGGLVSTTGNQTYNDQVSVGGALAAVDFVASNAAATITFNNAGAIALDLGTKNGTITAEEINWNTAAANKVRGTGVLTLQPFGLATPILVAGIPAAGQLDLTAAEIGALQNGFSQINIGRAAGTGVITNNAVTWNDPVTYRSPGGGGQIVLNGQITGLGNASIELDATGGTMLLDTNVVTAGNAIRVRGATELVNAAIVRVDSTNNGGTPAGNDITFFGTVGDDAVVTPSGLVLDAGTAGNIDFQQTVGTPFPLAFLTVFGASSTRFGSDVTTGGAQSITSTTIRTNGTHTTADNIVTFAGNVVLQDNTTVTTGNGAVNFNGTVNDDGVGPASGLAVNSTGTTVFAGGVGGTPLNSLTTDAGGQTRIAGGVITTSGAAGQVFGDDVVLFGNTTLNANNGGDLTFNGTINGNAAGRTLNLNTTGATSLNGVVGGGAFAPASLTTNAGGTTSINTSAISTTGLQTYNDDVTLQMNSTLTGTTISFTDGLDLVNRTLDIAGNFALAGTSTLMARQDSLALFGNVDVTGTVSLNNANLSMSRLASFVPAVNDSFLLINNGNGAAPGQFNSQPEGSTVDVGGIPETITYAGNPPDNDVVLTTEAPTTVYVDDAWLGTAIGSNPANNPVAGGLVFGYNAFADVQSGINQVATNGTLVIFAGNYGATNINKDLQPIQANINSTTPAQVAVSFSGAVTLTNDASFSMTAFTPPASPVQAAADQLFFNAAVHGPQALSVSGPGGAVIVNGAVGAVTALSSLTTGAGVGANISGGTVRTDGDQTYNGTVFVGQNVAFTSDTGTLAFNSTLNLSFRTGTLTADAIDFNGGAGSVSGTNTITLQPVLDGTSIGVDNLLGTLQLTATDLAALNTNFSQINIGRSTGTGVINIGTAATVTFNDPVRFRTPGGTGIITVNAQLQGNGNGSLVLDATGGTVELADDLVTNGNTIQVLGSTELVNNGTVLIDTTNGGGVAAGNDIAFLGTVGDDDATPAALQLRAGTGGNIDLQQAVGVPFPLQSLTVISADTARFGSSVTTSGAQDVTATTIQTNGTHTTTNSAVTFSGNVELQNNTTVTTGNGPINFNNGTVDDDGVGPASNLIVNTTGVADFNGAVGGNAPLNSLTSDAGGITSIQGGAVTTSGAAGMVFNDVVRLEANTTLTAQNAGAVTFNDVLRTNGFPFTLAINTAGATSFNGVVGPLLQELGSLTTDAGGTTSINTTAISTTGAQTYNDDVTLGMNSTLTGTTISFTDGLDLVNHTLDIAGNFSLAGTSTLMSRLDSLAVFGNIDVAGTVSLSNANLSVTRLAGFVPTLGDSFLLIDNGAGVAPGQFNGQPEGSTVNVGGIPETITYAGNPPNNDVVLTTEGAATAYVDDTWAGTAIGANPANNPVAGGLIFGFNAFADVQSGLDNTADGGTLVIFGGTYLAAVDVNKDLQPIQINVNSTVPAETVVNLNGAVTLTNNTSFSQTGFAPPVPSPAQNPADLSFGSTIDSGAIARQLDFFAGVPAVNLTFGGAVGVGSALESLSTSAALALVNLNGGMVSTSGAGGQVYNGPVTLGGNTTLNVGGGAPASFNGPLDIGTLTLTVNGRITFAGTTTLNLQINSATVFGHIIVSGTADLFGAALNVASVFTPGPSDGFVLIDTGAGNSGTFAGLPEGAIVNVGGVNMKITYQDGGDGLDVALGQPPVITSVNNTTFTAGQFNSFFVTTTGFPPAAITRTGALPAGVTFVDLGNGTARLSGTPAANTAGVYNLVITADNGIDPDAVQNFRLTVVYSASPALVAGRGPGSTPEVRVFDGRTGALRFNFLAYGAGFRGGVRVAVGDVNRDGFKDIITGPGAGLVTRIKVFSGRTGGLLRKFNAFPTSFTGGVYVAAGDVNGDGFSDIIVGKGQGTTEVRVFNGRNGALLKSFVAFLPSYVGGVRVAAGDVNGDGRADIIAANGPGGHVKVFTLGGAVLKDFYALRTWPGNVFVAAGDFNRDGRADIVVGNDTGGSPQVNVFDGRTNRLLTSFNAFASSFRGGVRVAAGDLNGDGRADLVAGQGPSGVSQAKAYRGTGPTLFVSFFAFPSAFKGGVFVAAG